MQLTCGKKELLPWRNRLQPEVYKPKAIIEFNKVERPPGPPIHIRLTPEDVERLVTQHGFRNEWVIEVGPHNYLIAFDLCAIT